MNKLIWLLAIVSILIAVPAAEATIRFQSTGNGFFDITGPSSFGYYGSESSVVGGWDAQQIAVASGSSFGGLSFNMRRPTYVQQHTFENQNQNFRTVEYGNWQVRQVHVSHKPSQSAFSYARTPAGAQVNGYVAGYRTVNPRSVYASGLNGYDARHNTHAFYGSYRNGQYHQPATLSARTAPRAYW